MCTLRTCLLFCTAHLAPCLANLWEARTIHLPYRAGQPHACQVLAKKLEANFSRPSIKASSCSSSSNARLCSMSRKENALDLAKFVDKGVRVKLSGGREDPEDPLRITDTTRSLGLVVCRGTAVMMVSPTSGTEEIANPFSQEED